MLGGNGKEKGNSLEAQVRPGSLDVVGQQVELFPFDAFNFTYKPQDNDYKISLKEPWMFDASTIDVGDIVGDSLRINTILAHESYTMIDGGDPTDPPELEYDGGNDVSAEAERVFNDNTGKYVDIPLDYIAIESPLFMREGVMGTLQSSNYEEGVDGWSLQPNGDAEFNNGVFRGHIEAESGTFKGVVNTSGGIFGDIYSGQVDSFSYPIGTSGEVIKNLLEDHFLPLDAMLPFVGTIDPPYTFSGKEYSEVLGLRCISGDNRVDVRLNNFPYDTRTITHHSTFELEHELSVSGIGGNFIRDKFYADPGLSTSDLDVVGLMSADRDGLRFKPSNLMVTPTLSKYFTSMRWFSFHPDEDLSQVCSSIMEEATEFSSPGNRPIIGWYGNWNETRVFLSNLEITIDATTVRFRNAAGSIVLSMTNSSSGTLGKFLFFFDMFAHGVF
jgi:hypothetical protein